MALEIMHNQTIKLTLVVTRQCNFDCRYCLQKHEDMAMPEEMAKKAIDDLIKGVLFRLERMQKTSEGTIPKVRAQISFYGGEPLLQRPLIEKLVKYARARFDEIDNTQLIFEITTNGTLLDEAFVSFARENRIILALSHDGLAQDMVRLDRGGHPTKAIVDQKLDMILRTFPDTIVMMTIHPDHVDKIADSLKFFREKGVCSVSMVLAHGERVLWTDEQFEKLSSEMEKVEKLYEQWNLGDNVFRFIPFENKIKNYIRGKDADSAPCHFGYHKLMVDTDGKYYPCSHFIGREGFDIGSISEGVDDSRLESLESQRIEPQDCVECALRSRCHHTCACANHGHTGTMTEVSALQCEYERLLIRLSDQAASFLMQNESPKFIERMYRG